MKRLIKYAAACLTSFPLLAGAQTPTGTSGTTTTTTDTTSSSSTSVAPQPAAPTASAAAPSPAQAAKAPAVVFTPYGFVHLGMFFEAGNFSGGDYPLFATGPLAWASGNTLFEARQTRLGFKIDVPNEGSLVGGVALKAVIETDFGGGFTGYPPAQTTRERQNQIMRLRLAYASAAWKEAGNFTIVAGQDYSPIAPLFELSLAHKAGPKFFFSGGIFRRVPQLKIMGDIGSDFAITYQLAAVTPISADAGESVEFGPGNRARMPDFEGRLAAKYVAEKKTLFELGLSGHIGKERFAITGVPKEDMEASSKILAADLQINLPYVALRGEAFRGFNADTAWGALGTGVIFNRGPATGTTPGPILSVRDEVRSSGGWGQLILTPIPQIQIFGGGGIERIDQNQWALLGTGRTQNGRITAGIIAALTKRWSASFEWTETHTHTATQKFKSSQFAIANQLEF